jgi:hypothetical protein
MPFGWGRAMPTQTLLRVVETEQQEEEGGSFGPDEITVMTAAFEGILSDFRLKDRDDPVVQMIAKLVIELVRNGERDPVKVRKEILARPRLM